MFACLRHDANIGSNDQQGAINAGGASDHIVYEAMMPGDINKADRFTRVWGQEGITEINGQAAGLLLGDVSVSTGSALTSDARP